LLGVVGIAPLNVGVHAPANFSVQFRWHAHVPVQRAQLRRLSIAQVYFQFHGRFVHVVVENVALRVAKQHDGRHSHPLGARRLTLAFFDHGRENVPNRPLVFLL
jgi:hypothetical protein